VDSLIIEGPARLQGSVQISGSKNTALPLLFGSLLFDDEVRYTNVPRLWDIETTLKLLQDMGCESSWDKEEGKVSILPRVKQKVAPYEWVRKMRAGVLALGPLVAKYGEAKVSLPGGCAIGARPVNYHIEAMRKMGVKLEVEEGYILATVPSQLRGAEIFFPEVTVTGTENLLFVASVAEGKTILENSAREPEVVALGEWLVSCGALIRGLGTSRIEIEGVPKLFSRENVVIPPDRIETGTWISIAMATGSSLTLERTDLSKMTSVLDAYRKMGLGLESLNNGQALKIIPSAQYTPIELHTQPYPGFPTDMQAQILTSMCQANGKSILTENIFENRFMHVAELRRLGAKISVEGPTAIVEGPVRLTAAPIMATDLRASACLVVAALSAQGKTKISRIYHLDRGYQRLDQKLRKLGAVITRVAE
jgi:UDP-N-acetylglucosamine 1-carboxyvinyltransferase